MAAYHLRKAEKAITDRDEIYRLLKLGKYMSIAVSHNDVPYIFTVSYGYDEAHYAIYFHSAAEGQKIDVIRRNPKACATIIEDQGYNKEKCEHYYNSLVIRGEIQIVDRLEEKKEGLGILLKHLEDHPDPIRQRNVADDRSYERVTILKLLISDISGKHN